MTLEEFTGRFHDIGSSNFSGEPFTRESNKDGVVVATAQIGPLEEGGTAHIGQILFVDGRVAHFRVIYNNYTDQFAWEDVDQFVEKTAAALGLPKTWVQAQSLSLEENRDIWRAKYDLLSPTTEPYRLYWNPADQNKEERFLLCGAILISAGVPSPGKRHWTNGAFIQFDDLAALSKLKARVSGRQVEEELKEGKQREEFKP